jgi:tRNA A-37 threonylcarbamoyl transferase component Bud32
VQCLKGRALPEPLVIVDDTSEFMGIDRDHVVDLAGELFLITGTEREKRFGLTGEPKPWVKRAIGLSSGRVHVIKMVFAEVFRAQVGEQCFRCERSAEKEARVLELVDGDVRFMHGHALRDTRGNLVRVLDFIHGIDLYSCLGALEVPHEEYLWRNLPQILHRVIESLRAIQILHDAGLCHGDIRNDHILVEQGSGAYRWIDFDLDQGVAAFDVWSVGNILHFIVGKKVVRLTEVLRERPDLIGHVGHEDAALFFPYRLQNLGKLFPYLPRCINDVLLRFAVGSTTRYDSVAQVVEDLQTCEQHLGWPGT